MALSMKEFLGRALRGESVTTGAFTGPEDAANKTWWGGSQQPAREAFTPKPAPARTTVSTVAPSQPMLRKIVVGPSFLDAKERIEWLMRESAGAGSIVSAEYLFNKDQTQVDFSDGSRFLVEGNVKGILSSTRRPDLSGLNGGITAAQLAGLKVTPSITAANIAAGAITVDKIAAGVMGDDPTMRCKDKAQALARTVAWLRKSHPRVLEQTDAGKHFVESQYAEVVFEVAAGWDFRRYPSPKDEQRYQYVARLKKEMLAYTHDAYVALRRHVEPGWMDPATGPATAPAIALTAALPSTANVGDVQVHPSGRVMTWSGTAWVEVISSPATWPSGETPYPVSYNEAPAPRVKAPKAKPVPVATEQDIDALTSEIAEDLSVGGDW